MAFCARFDSRSHYLYEIDEIIIPFHNRSDNLAEFLDAHQKQRVIVDVRDEWKNFYAAIFTPLVEKYPNLVIRVSEITPELSTALKNINATFFSAQIAAHWEVLYYLASLGVSDIYIGEQLCFELNDVSKAADRKSVV